MLPDYWQKFINDNQLIGKELELSEEDDLSGLGAELKIMNEEQSKDEATNFYPGMIVINHGYIPVAMCMSGSGDYYYINKNEGKGGALYRIYHDSVNDSGLNEDAVDKIIDNYEKLLS